MSRTPPRSAATPIERNRSPSDPDHATSPDADAALADILRWERAARIVADDPALSIKAKCKALLDMSFRARRSELAAFLEVAIWRGCRHLFEEDVEPADDAIGAIRGLLRRGHTSCTTCRRPLPDHDTLDWWLSLRYDTRRPA